MPNGRCRLHGGLSPAGAAAPGFKTGRYSKVLPVRLAARFNAALADPNLLSLMPELALLDALTADALGRFDARGSASLRDELIAARERYQQQMAALNLDGAGETLEDIWALLERGQQERTALGELGDLMDRRGRLVSAETRRVAAAQESLTAAQAMVFVAALTSAVREHVHDRSTLAAIQAAFVRTLDRHEPDVH